METRDGTRASDRRPGVTGGMDAAPEGARVLIVEDDRKTADLVGLYLRHAGHRATIATSGSTGLELAERHAFDLLILDVMLPGTDGLDICRRVRARSRTPIIFLTAKTLEDERVQGLELGADDYVTKPFSPRELVARVNALLRRVPPGAGDVRSAGDLRLDLETRRLTIGEEEVPVTPSELEIVAALLERPGRVLSRAQLVRRLPTEGETPLERIIDVHVRNLRRKLAVHPGGPEHIETVFGAGYRCRETRPGRRPEGTW